jgi:transposase
MSTGKPRDPSKERFWRTMVQQWRRSGLSVRAFCYHHGLAQPSFYAWRRTLAQRDAAVQFVPVRLAPEPPTNTSASTSPLELVLANGRRLRVAPGFDAATLTRLLTLLEEGQPCS